MAIDNGKFSFVDVQYNSWPIVLVTSPPHALYAPSEDHHPTQQIRILAWSPAAFRRVAVRVDGDKDWSELRHVSGPVYVGPWQSAHVTTGLHTLEVFVEDVEGRTKTLLHPFSHDGTQPSFSFVPRLLLMSNVSAVFQFLFGCSVCVCVLVLCIFKYLHFSMSSAGRQNICRGGIFRWTFIRALVRKIWILSSVDQIFWPLIIYMLYLPVGPWMVGELLDKEYGVIFAWGTFVHSSFLPGSLTFAYGFFLFIFYVLPLVLGLAHCIDLRLRSLYITPPPHTSRLSYISKHVHLFIPLVLQIYLTYTMFLAYGWISIVVGPIRSWSVILGIGLWFRVEKLQPRHLRSAADLWYNHRHTTVSLHRRNDTDDGTNSDASRTSWHRIKNADDECFHSGDVPQNQFCDTKLDSSSSESLAQCTANVSCLSETDELCDTVAGGKKRLVGTSENENTATSSSI